MGIQIHLKMVCHGLTRGVFQHISCSHLEHPHCWEVLATGLPAMAIFFFQLAVIIPISLLQQSPEHLNKMAERLKGIPWSSGLALFWSRCVVVFWDPRVNFPNAKRPGSRKVNQTVTVRMFWVYIECLFTQPSIIFLVICTYIYIHTYTYIYIYVYIYIYPNMYATSPLSSLIRIIYILILI